MYPLGQEMGKYRLLGTRGIEFANDAVAKRRLNKNNNGG